MSANITFNPVVTTNAAGSFNTSSQGYIQGTALNDPAVRNALAGGILGPNETLPMWGGVAVSESITPVGVALTSPNRALGGYLTRASTVTAISAGGISGFSVFDQAHAMINTPQSPVPLSSPSMLVNYYRLGSGARIAVKIAPSLISLANSIITTQVSWDFVDQQIVPYAAQSAGVAITNAVWANTAGGQITFTLGDLTASYGVGDYLPVSGVINSGGTSTGAFNGSWPIVSINATTAVVTAPASATLGTYVSGGTGGAGGGAAPFKILDIQIGNSMTVAYDNLTGFATWNRSGNCAIIQI